jgi:hypothetical protein
MATVTLELPDELATLVEQQRDRLPELLALSLHSPPLLAQLYRDILHFFASQPTPEEIAAFRPSQVMQERLRLLVGRAHDGSLTAAEAAELGEFERVEHLVVMIKSANLPALTSRV